MSHIIVLKDGPHNIEPPTGKEVAALQRLGYPIGKQFSVFTLMTNITEKKVKNKKTGEVEKHAVFTPDSEVNLTAICDHIAVCMRDPSWDADRVAEQVIFPSMGDYYVALRELAKEAFGSGEDADPKASSTKPPA